MKSGKILLIAVLSMVFAAGICAQGSAAAAPQANSESTAKNAGSAGPGPQSGALVPIDDPNYTIGPEDELNINVWKEPEVTRMVPVRPDGKISLPLINDVQAAGLTPMQLRKELQERLKKFIAEPQVTVIVTKINSQRVFVVGEVMRAGSFALVSNMNALQALSSAGGFTQFANVKKIRIVRMENGKQIIIPFNYKDAVSGKHPEGNVLLKPGDTIVVP
ncbi:MAG: polysaccharide biosynthesis/export family protein [Acidobacteriia bacterium]|nr:polysaccharide biosynthesis/export family protein [Terriglobia bacterium]